MSTRPLADEIRPQSLDEVVGQRHLIGPGGVLRRLIDAGTSANMIFYGPSGTGKTTIANIIANKTNKTLYRLNATTASLQDVKDIIASVGTLMAPGGILLYLDEIQYFNKKQQQSLLEFMENGSITLIASTTENPFFYVYNALLSRSTVFEFKQVEPRELLPAVERALGILKERSPLPLAWEEGVPMQIATQCGGDVRKAINACDPTAASARSKRNLRFLCRISPWRAAIGRSRGSSWNGITPSSAPHAARSRRSARSCSTGRTPTSSTWRTLPTRCTR